MDFTSPLFVVPLIAVVFLSCILWATRTDPAVKGSENGHSGH